MLEPSFEVPSAAGTRTNWRTRRRGRTKVSVCTRLRALSALKRRCAVKLYTDSKYVLQGYTEWLPGWKARGWRTAAREPVKNQDLWEQLDTVAAAQDIEWHWVKGHSGHEQNEYVDQLANLAIDHLLARR